MPKCNAICPPQEHKHKDGSIGKKLDGYYPKEKRWSAIVFVPGHGQVEYQFDSRDIRDAISYLVDNVRDDFERDLQAKNIIKLEIID